MPPAVAMPLPPENPSQIGKQWPRMAASPAAACHSGLAVTSRMSRTATTPLPMSRAMTGSATFQPAARIALVAPTLPEPTWRTSPLPAAFTSSRANGIDPRR